MEALPLLLPYLLVCSSLLSVHSFPTRDTHVVVKTLTVIHKPSCYVLPTATVLPSCDVQRNRRWLQIESWPVWGSWMQLPPPFPDEPRIGPGEEQSDEDDDNVESANGMIVESSMFEPLRPTTFNFPWGGWNAMPMEQQRLPVTITSTSMVTTTLQTTQRLVPDCLDSNENYEPACPAKSIKKEWGYHGLHGPDQWREIDVTCASGEEESPIEIIFSDTIVANFPELELAGYDTNPSEYLVENNGHTLVVSLKSSSQTEAKKGGLRSDYVFSQMHLHWGETSEVGSEHVVDGKRYPMEIHMVHYNKNYGSVQRSVAHRDGLEVLAIFVKISESDNPIFDPLIRAAGEVITPDSKKTLSGDSFTLDDFLPDSGDFYRYHGSLTTPNCNQAVYWTVFSEPITISEEQIDVLRNLKDHSNESLAGNYRPLQKLFGREVFRNF